MAAVRRNQCPWSQGDRSPGTESVVLDTRAHSACAGKPNEAAADIEQSLASRPSAAAIFHQSLVEQRLGNQRAARDSLDKANELGLKMEGIASTGVGGFIANC